jgi:hypothetical protein
VVIVMGARKGTEICTYIHLPTPLQSNQTTHPHQMNHAHKRKESTHAKHTQSK